MTTKICTKCLETKPIGEFHKDRHGKDGLRPDCKVCHKTRSHEYYRTNREKELARKAEYVQANREKVNIGQAEYYLVNQDKLAAYRAANPHIAWEANYRYRCREFGLTPFIVSFTREDVINQYGSSCSYCPTGAFEELDHDVPVAAGGPHTLANGRPSCAKCNLQKLHSTDREAIKAKRLEVATGMTTAS